MLPRIYLFLCVTFWGWTFVATKIVLDYMSPVELLGLRFLLGLPVLFVVIKAKKLQTTFTPRDRRGLVLGAIIIAAHFFIQVTGIKYTSATNTGWIISVTPLVMAVLAYLVHRERIGWRGVTGIIIATIGIILLMSKGDITQLDWLESVGDWLVLASAHTWALYTVATRNVTRSVNPLTVTFWILTPSGVLFLGYMLFTSDWSRFLQLPAEAVVALLFLGILGLAIAHWFWQEGVAEIGASRAGIFLYLEPIATTALAVPYLNEQFGWATGTGGMLVLAGVWWAQRRPRQKVPA